MKIRLLFFALLAILSIQAQTSMKGELLLSATIGLNNPFKNYNAGTSLGNYYNNLGWPTGTFYRYTNTRTIIQPISLDADLMLSKSTSLYVSGVFQMHSEKHEIVDKDSGLKTGEWTEKHSTTSVLIGFRFAWLKRENYQIGSAIGVGGSFLTVSGPYPDSNGSGSLDIHPLFFRYSLNPNWSLTFDTRIMTGPLGGGEPGDIAGYNLGFGVIYRIKSKS